MKVEPETMAAAADRACELLKSLAHRSRLMIVCQLLDGEKSVGQLADFLGVRDSNVSQHLSMLRRDGVLSARRDAQTVYYSIANEPARHVVEVLYQSFCASC